MKKGSIPHQIIGSFEDIGKSILEETARVPSSLVSSALESPQGAIPDTAAEKGTMLHGEGKPVNPDSALARIDKKGDNVVRQAIARAALKELTGNPNEPEEASVYDEKIREAEEAKRKQKDETKAQEYVLKPQSAKQKRGDPYAAQAKAKSTEAKFRGTE